MPTIAHIPAAAHVRARPSASARAVGVMPARSRYLDAAMAVPLLARSSDGRWGKVQLPWRSDGAIGWIELRGMRLTQTPYSVVVLAGRRELQLRRRGRVVARMRAGIGATTSPTPTGRYWVTDRTAVTRQRAAFGSYAFGLSGLQPRLPRNWTGGDQLAIHGTGNPASIGKAASAGCVRVSEADLARLRRALVPGTPVVVRP